MKSILISLIIVLVFIILIPNKKEARPYKRLKDKNQVKPGWEITLKEAGYKRIASLPEIKSAAKQSSSKCTYFGWVEKVSEQELLVSIRFTPKNSKGSCHTTVKWGEIREFINPKKSDIYKHDFK